MKMVAPWWMIVPFAKRPAPLDTVACSVWARMKATTSSFVLSSLILVPFAGITGIFSWTSGSAGIMASGRIVSRAAGITGLAGPEAGGVRESRRTVARMPIMHPIPIRMALRFVSREDHLPFIFPVNQFIDFVFIFTKNVRRELYRLPGIFHPFIADVPAYKSGSSQGHTSQRASKVRQTRMISSG
jgi:hypothetical protein